MFTKTWIIENSPDPKGDGVLPNAGVDAPNAPVAVPPNIELPVCEAPNDGLPKVFAPNIDDVFWLVPKGLDGVVEPNGFDVDDDPPPNGLELDAPKAKVNI